MVPWASHSHPIDKERATPGRSALFTMSLGQENLLCFPHYPRFSVCLPLCFVLRKGGVGSVPSCCGAPVAGCGGQEGCLPLTRWVQAALLSQVPVLQDCKYNFSRIIKTVIETITIICSKVAAVIYWALGHQA